MDVSFSTNSSPQPAAANFQTLPRDILVDICSRVANRSLTDIRNLELVSKSLSDAANDNFVVRNLPLDEVPLFPSYWNVYPGRFTKFMKRCRKEGNPEAIFRKGFISYFHNTSETRQQNKGLSSMIRAAESGHEEAQYVSGLIMLCLGEEYVPKGLLTLYPLLKGPMLSTTCLALDTLRRRNMDHLWWFAGGRRAQLKTRYKASVCNCDGKTTAQNMGWCRFGSDNDMPISSACLVCVWDYEVRKFLD